MPTTITLTISDDDAAFLRRYVKRQNKERAPGEPPWRLKQAALLALRMGMENMAAEDGWEEGKG